MTTFEPTKYFVRKIEEKTDRFDIEFLDPRHKKLEAYLERIKDTKNFNLEPISSFCDPFSGKTSDKYVESGVPIIKLRNVTGKGIDWDTDFVEESFLFENETLRLAKDDVLLTSTGDGTIGRVDIYEKEIPAITDGHVTVLRVKNGQIQPKYLLYFLRSRLGQVQIERRIVGSTGQTELNDSDIKTILIAYHKDATYRDRIINEVSDAEEEALKKENAVETELNKIDYVLSKLLFSEIASERSKFYVAQLTASSKRMDFEFNDPFYEEYEKLTTQCKYPFVELEQLVSFSSDTINPMEKPDEQFLYVDIGNIDTRWGKMIPETLMGSEATSSRMRRLIHSGQIILSTTRPTRRAIAIVPEELDGQVCSTGFAVLECNTRIITEYLFHVLRASFMIHQFERFSTGWVS